MFVTTEVVFGAANQAGEDNRNVARMAALLAGFPDSVPGVTVNRLCASGLTAVATAASMVRAGDADLVLAGGVESMTRAPWVMAKPEKAYAKPGATFDTSIGWRFANPRFDGIDGGEATFSMPQTAEKVAEIDHISREDADAFALRSHQRAVAAIDAGFFAPEIVPVPVTTRTGTHEVDTDEGPRKDTTAESLAKLRPAFPGKDKSEELSVTAGNASSLNDGAAALVVVSEQFAKDHGLEILARVTGYATGGGEPQDLFFAPIIAVQKLMAKTGARISDYDLIEANEAFASQSIADGRGLGWDDARVNVNGGAIALGHPIGASGARILTTLLYAMKDRGKRTGLATLCLGGGNAVALSVERPS